LKADFVQDSRYGHGTWADLLEVIVDGGESAKNLNRPGLQRLIAMVEAGKVKAVIVAKLDRLTRSVKHLCGRLSYLKSARWR
jgi:DNA invertase Pin-like site-specific DNA recombinase